MSRTVTGLFRTPAEAESAISALIDAGFVRRQITFIARNPYANPAANDQYDEERGSVEGVKLGAEIGGIAGLLMGIATVFFPAFGAVYIIGSSLVGLAAGAGVGAAAGGLMGLINQEGIPPEESSVFAEEVQRGGSLVLVRVEDLAYVSRAEQILADAGAMDLADRRLKKEAPHADTDQHVRRGALEGEPMDAERLAQRAVMDNRATDMGVGETPDLMQQTDRDATVR